MTDANRLRVRHSHHLSSASIATGVVVNYTENPFWKTQSFSRNLIRKHQYETESSAEDIVNFINVNNGHVADCKLNSELPSDRYNLAYIIFYLLGFGTLLPWNFFITANMYFGQKFKNSDFSGTFQNYFSVAAMAPNVSTMFMNIVILSRINRNARMIVSLCIMFLMFALTTILVLVDSKEWTTTFFFLTIGTIVIINTSSGMLQGSLFGLAGMFPLRYTQAVMGGQGFGGLFAAVTSIIALSAHGDLINSSFGYFFCASFVLLICIAGFFALLRLDYVQCITKGKEVQCTCKSDEDSILDFINEDAITNNNNSEKPDDISKKITWTLVKKIFPMALSVNLVFFVTLAAFPALTARIQSVGKEGSAWKDKFFTPVACFLLFNLGDFIGRTIAAPLRKPGPKGPWLLLLCIARIGFFPLFAYCNVQPRSIDVVFNHDAYPIIFMLLFSASNGYLGSLTMMYGPKVVDSSQAEIAGITMAFSLALGLAFGAGFSFVLTGFV